MPWRLLKITRAWHDVTMREKRNMQYKDMAIFLDYIQGSGGIKLYTWKRRDSTVTGYEMLYYAWFYGANLDERDGKMKYKKVALFSDYIAVEVM